MRRVLIDAPRWLLLGALVYAPWAYGCTRPWTIHVLNALLGALLLLWIVASIARKKLPAIHPLLLCAVTALLALGWTVALNARSSYDLEFHQFVPLASFWKSGPGSVNREVSIDMMWRVSGLLGALCFTADLSRRKQWRSRLWWTLVLTGASVIAFGLVQKILEAPMIFWEHDRTGETFFATFFYHGNAGAFINLILPLAAGLVLSAFREKRAHREKAMAACALFLAIIGAFVNVSKAGMVIALLLDVALVVWQLPRFIVMRDRALRPMKLAGISIAILLIAGIATGLSWEMIAKRWQEMPELMSAKNPRLLMFQSCVRIVSGAGAFGFGPGTFETIFPHLNPPTGPTGIWRYAHQDYLQTLIEWGWTGAALWALIFAGGIFYCLRGWCRHAGSERVLLFVSALALFGIALHAMIDFPLQIASLQLYTAVLLGLGWGSSDWEKSARSGH